MADADLAQRVTGYVLGGISPLGQKRRSPLWLDQSALSFDTLYMSADGGVWKSRWRRWICWR